jgi:hypothetical protein
MEIERFLKLDSLKVQRGRIYSKGCYCTNLCIIRTYNDGSKILPLEICLNQTFITQCLTTDSKFSPINRSCRWSVGNSSPYFISVHYCEMYFVANV